MGQAIDATLVTESEKNLYPIKKPCYFCKHVIMLVQHYT